MHLAKRVLVTGGAGFLGSHLCENLLEQECEVICVDNLYTGTKRNILHLLDNPFVTCTGANSDWVAYLCPRPSAELGHC